MTDQGQLEQVEKQIEISIEAAKGAVERKNAIQRLHKNPDFRLIFVEGYFQREPARLVSLLTDHEHASEEKQRELMNDMLGISSAQEYLRGVHSMGVAMERQIASSEQTLEDMRNESEEEEL